MEIKIERYLNDSEIKEIVQDELRNQVRKFFSGTEENTQRLLSNLAYSIVRDEVDKIVPNYEEELINKVAELIKSKDLSFHVFNYHYSTNAPTSFGSKVIEQTVKENQQLIKDKVVKTIQETDYSEQALMKFESLADDFTSNIYDFVNLMRDKNNG
jgi:hypothetical protein